ncbi:MAG TPA: dihydropteroate synthase, partial [Leucothrix sp.]|nr:dihydropteroate synthase [Leucothrix sp.]
MDSQNQRPLIMGILNVTPDSFSDGGQYNKLDQAIDRAREMLEQGADIIDIGGESTRPGADSISTSEQIDRVVPVIEGIRNYISEKVVISVDTTDYHVALAALEADANWINDVSAGEDAHNIDSDIDRGSIEPMLELAAGKQVPIVLMHRKGKSSTMQDAPSYQNVSLEVKNYLNERA